MQETLQKRLQHLIGDTPRIKVAEVAGISTGTLHYLLSGKTTEPKPSTLRALAESFGGNSLAAKQQTYAELMLLAGYFEMLPAEMLRVLEELSISKSNEKIN